MLWLSPGWFGAQRAEALNISLLAFIEHTSGAWNGEAFIVENLLCQVDFSCVPEFSGAFRCVGAPGGWWVVGCTAGCRQAG